MRYTNTLLLSLLGLPALAQQPDTTRKIKQLDSVVVYHTGYQSVTKSRTAGSFTQVDNRTLNLQTGTNILARLEGLAPAVAFSRKTNSTIPALSLRGLGTINGPTAPLIILDNFPYEGNIADINPNMIESVTLLKDATAASIWGTRAGNGVIVINTKKGRTGQPLTTELSTSFRADAQPNLYRLHPIKAADYIGMEQFLFSKGYYNSSLNGFNHPALSPVVEILDHQNRGLLSPADAAAQLAFLSNLDVRDQFDKGVYRTGLLQQYALSLKGGTGQAGWFAAGGYDRTAGTLAEIQERVSARIENEFRPLAGLRFSTSLQYTSTTSRSGRSSWTGQQYLYPYSRLWDDNGNPMPHALTYRKEWTDTAGGGRLLDWNFYPATEYLHNTTLSRSAHLLANTGLNLNLGAGFDLEARYQYESQQDQADGSKDPQSYESRNWINLYSQPNYQTGVVKYIVPAGGILDRSGSGLKVQNLRGQLNYNRRFSSFQLTALTGAEQREIRTSGAQFRTWGYDAVNASGSPVDYRNTYPQLPSGSYSNLPYSDGFTERLNRYLSFYANAALTWNRRYSLNLSGRRDASNLFGATTNNKWTPLWSAGLAWDLAQEPFYRLSWLPQLKTRVTYGFTGNADPSRSAVATVYAFGNTLGSGLPFYRLQQFPNPSLRWEKVGITNFGIDFSALDQRLGGSLEYYTKNGTGLFATVPVDLSTGISATGVIKNVADMKARGLDIQLSSRNTRGKLQWRSSLILSWNSDKVTRAYTTNNTGANFLSDGNTVSAIVGRPVHSILSYKWGGLDPTNGNPIGFIGGKPSTDYTAITGSGSTLDDLEYSGPAMPQWYGSVLNSLSYQRWELTVGISFKARYFFRRPGLNYSQLFSGSDRKGTADFARRWQQPGDENNTTVPSMVYPAVPARDAFYNASSILVERGDHIRLQFINLACNLEWKRGNRQQPVRLQCFANASNLGILWRANRYGIDPDYSITDIPAGAAWSLGLKCTIQ